MNPASYVMGLLCQPGQGAIAHRIDPGSIDFIEDQGDEGPPGYVQINAGGKGYLAAHSLAELEGWLDPARFVSIDRTFLLNLACIDRIACGPAGPGVLLDDGSFLPLSRHGHDALCSRLAAWPAASGHDDMATTSGGHSASALTYPRNN